MDQHSVHIAGYTGFHYCKIAVKRLLQLSSSLVSSGSNQCMDGYMSNVGNKLVCLSLFRLAEARPSIACHKGDTDAHRRLSVA